VKRLLIGVVLGWLLLVCGDSAWAYRQHAVVRTEVVQLHALRGISDTATTCLVYTRRDGKRGVGDPALLLEVGADSLIRGREVPFAYDYCAPGLRRLGIELTTPMYLRDRVRWQLEPIRFRPVERGPRA
jgi:hypothetical protein